MQRGASHCSDRGWLGLLAAVFLLLGGGAQAAPPNPNRQSTAGPRLIGTVVFQGGGSFAYFDEANGRFRKVWEGETLSDGAQLLKVRKDRIVIRRDGVEEQVPLFLFTHVNGPAQPVFNRATGRRRR